MAKKVRAVPANTEPYWHVHYVEARFEALEIVLNALESVGYTACKFLAMAGKDGVTEGFFVISRKVGA